MFAAANGEVLIIAELVERGTDLALRAQNGWTALSFACALGHYEAVGKLLKAAASRGEEQTMVVQSALGLARAHKQSEVAALLEELTQQASLDIGAALQRAQEVWRAGGMRPRMEMSTDEQLPTSTGI